MTLIIVVGLAVAHLLTFTEIRYERERVMREMILTGIERDIASSIAILDRLPAQERDPWLARLERPNYRFSLGGTVSGPQPETGPIHLLTQAIVTALRPLDVVAVARTGDGGDGARVQVRLSDGAAVIIDARRSEMPVYSWIVWILLAQLAVLAGCAWYATWLATRPLAQLAAAAKELGPDLKGRVLDEGGPSEVAHAARAFNAMQQRIGSYTAERVEILAAISHDLKTPITRLRLRTDLLDSEADRAKFGRDLDAMNALVKEGVTYARTLHGASEPPCRIDADTLFESMVADYEDAGEEVLLEGQVGTPIVTRPNALRRILMNLVDNALKFAGGVRIRVHLDSDRLHVSVIDNGPGIPPEHLVDVLKPFYRIEPSRNRQTGGTGLGLAIAQQLAMAMGAELLLLNLPEGGLEARLTVTTFPESDG